MKIEQAFGFKNHMWTVTAFSTKRGYVIAKCDCGTSREIYWFSIKNGKSKCCGCVTLGRPFERHGLGANRDDPTYNCWINLKQRCLNPNTPEWGNYGGRGISVCERWKNSFKFFLEDMGTRPDGHFIDRKDVNGNYSPENCHWIPASASPCNQRRNRLMIIDGIQMCAKDACAKHGVSYDAFCARLNRKGEAPIDCLNYYIDKMKRGEFVPKSKRNFFERHPHSSMRVA